MTPTEEMNTLANAREKALDCHEIAGWDIEKCCELCHIDALAGRKISGYSAIVNGKEGRICCQAEGFLNRISSEEEGAELDRLRRENEELKKERGLLKEALDPKIEQLHFENGVLDLATSSPAFYALIAGAVDILREFGGENYLSIRMNDKRDGTQIEVLLKYIKGKTPAEVNGELKSELSSLRKRVEEVEELKVWLKSREGFQVMPEHSPKTAYVMALKDVARYLESQELNRKENPQ
jgi:hypothetical protein